MLAGPCAKLLRCRILSRALQITAVAFGAARRLRIHPSAELSGLGALKACWAGNAEQLGCDC